eukprot:4623323-Pleurochrysis_carterae.AAC.1
MFFLSPACALARARVLGGEPSASAHTSAQARPDSRWRQHGPVREYLVDAMAREGLRTCRLIAHPPTHSYREFVTTHFSYARMGILLAPPLLVAHIRMHTADCAKLSIPLCTAALHDGLAISKVAHAHLRTPG